MLNLLVSWVCKIALKITLVLNQNSFKCLLDCVSQKTVVECTYTETLAMVRL